MCLDTFYLGKLKGVGPVWQLTACDATCSYRVARLLPALSDEGAAAFPREVPVPLYQRAGWPPAGPSPPRHACTSGFVGRLQGTNLHEHWCIQFHPDEKQG